VRPVFAFVPSETILSEAAVAAERPRALRNSPIISSVEPEEGPLSAEPPSLWTAASRALKPIRL